jgi:Glycosyltransferase family 87
VVAVLAAVTLFAATVRAFKPHIAHDFQIYWQAGYDFAHGLPIYHSLPMARRFNYPPFAAQLFQVFGILPLRLAAWLFYLTSVALLVVALRVSRHLVHPADQSSHRSPAPLVLALLCSAVFVIDNLNHGQINLLILVLCLLGIQAVVLGREVAAGGWLVSAAAIKLTPALFVLWAMIRGGRRTILAVLGFGVLCLALPMAQRGWEQGLVDLAAYHQGFLQKFAAGHVITDERNQNLTAMIYRAAVPEPGGYAYLPGLAAAAPVINRALAATILAVLVIHLLKLRIARQPVNPLEIAAVFLASHLLSGITWKAHLVSLLFVSYAFFSLEWRPLSRGGRILLGAAWVGLAAIGLGRDLIGSRLHHALAGYSVYVWVLLLLFTLCIGWSGRTKNV